MATKAEARYVRISPQKARLVVDLIRGRKAGEAITILKTTAKRISPVVEKVLRSAIANAEKSAIARAVQDGLITQDRANTLQAAIDPTKIDLSKTWPPVGGFRGSRGFGRLGGFGRFGRPTSTPTP